MKCKTTSDRFEPSAVFSFHYEFLLPIITSSFTDRWNFKVCSKNTYLKLHNKGTTPYLPNHYILK